MRILGVDHSLTSTGMAVLEFPDGGRPKLVAVKSIKTGPRQPMPMRLDIIAAGVRSFAKDNAVDAAGVETGLVYRGRTTTLNLAQVRGVVLHSLYALGVNPIYDVNNSTAKKGVGAAQKDGKEAVQLGVRRRVSGVLRAHPNDDEADAIAIALAVHRGEGKLS